MSYSLSQNGNKADIMAKLRAQADTQRTALPSEAERQMLDADLAEIEAKVNQFAGDGDTISVSCNGSMSQTSQSFATYHNVGVTISKGQTAEAKSTGAATASSPTTGAASTANAPVASGATGSTAAASRTSGGNV